MVLFLISSPFYGAQPAQVPLHGSKLLAKQLGSPWGQGCAQ